MIPVGPNGQTSAVAYGAGSVWVTYYADDGGHVVRLDPATGKILDNIQVDASPTWETGGGGLAFGDGSIWLSGASSSGSLLARIDPSTDKVVAEIPLGDGSGADVAIDASVVWVMSFGKDGAGPMRVDRIDPETNQVVATISLAQDYGHYIFAEGGVIVAQMNETTSDVVGDTVLDFIDPATNTVIRTEPLRGYAWLGAGGGRLWLATDRTLEALDPGTGEVAATYSVPNTGGALTVGEGGVWFLNPTHRDSIHRLNPDTGVVDLSVDLPDQTGPIAMALLPGAVWVLNYEGSITRVAIG